MCKQINTLVFDVDNVRNSLINATHTINTNSTLMSYTYTPGIKRYISFDSVPVPIIRIGDNTFCTINIG